jgi:hypothetical protein
LIKNGACASLYSNTVTITVIQPVTIANAGPGQVLCNANANVTLQANTPSSGTGQWSLVSGPSTVSFTNPALSNTVVSGLKTGTYRFVWTISNGTCVNSTDTVIIKNDRIVSGLMLPVSTIAEKQLSIIPIQPNRLLEYKTGNGFPMPAIQLQQKTTIFHLQQKVLKKSHSLHKVLQDVLIRSAHCMM